MGNTIILDVCDLLEAGRYGDMGAMYGLSDALDALAERLDVSKLSAFFDYRELIEAYDEDPEAEVPPPSWFDAADGLGTIKSLRLRLMENFDALGWTPDKSTAHWPGQLMKELEFCESTLGSAVAVGQPFRLRIVP